MTTRTKWMATTDEASPGVPSWTNAVTTEVPVGETEIALENLTAGKRWWVKVWREDEFGHKSREIVMPINTPAPMREDLIQFSAQGVFDSGSPMYAYVKIPATVKQVADAQVTVSFRQFLANAQSAASSGTLTSNTDGTSTTPSGGGSTSGSSSASTSDNFSIPVTLATIDHVHSGGAHSTWDDPGGGSAIIDISPDHHHGMPHTHSTPSHTHTTPDHSHTVPGHTHTLVYGTFEEAYPSSHYVDVYVYKRESSSWVQKAVFVGLITDLEDLDMTPYITGPGDWRLAVISAPAQPNGGRLGCDLFGSITLLS